MRKEIVELGSAIKSLSEKYERDAPTLSESQRVTRQKQLVEQDRDMQRKRREFQEDLNARKNEELQQVLERANRVVKQVAESGEKYDANLPGGRVHQPQARHHGQGAQNPERRQRQIAGFLHGRHVALRLDFIIGHLGGELYGDPAQLIQGLAPLESAGASELSFLSHPKFRPLLAASGAGCVIVAPELAEAGRARGACIVVDQPYLYYARLSQLWKREHAPLASQRIHPSAVIDPAADIHPSASVGALCDRAGGPHRC